MRTVILDMMSHPLRHVGAGNMDRGEDGQDRARLPETGRKLSKLPAFIKTFKTENKPSNQVYTIPMCLMKTFQMKKF